MRNPLLPRFLAACHPRFGLPEAPLDLGWAKVCPCSVHGDALGLEKDDAACVRDRLTATTSLREIHRVPRCSGIELGQGRQSLFGEAVTVPTANASDEVGSGHGSRPVRYHLLKLRDRGRGLNDPHFVTRIDSAADEMHVRVDES